MWYHHPAEPRDPQQHMNSKLDCSCDTEADNKNARLVVLNVTWCLFSLYGVYLKCSVFLVVPYSIPVVLGFCLLRSTIFVVQAFHDVGGFHEDGRPRHDCRRARRGRNIVRLGLGDDVTVTVNRQPSTVNLSDFPTGPRTGRHPTASAPCPCVPITLVPQQVRRHIVPGSAVTTHLRI